MRIIAGKHKGLILKDFEYLGIRPTLDRVRESIFNIIQFDINGAEVLDLFGGTGAVSLEFLSRGATVTTGDISDEALSLINQNFKKAKETPNLIKGDYKETLKKLYGNKYDYIYLDPPFATDFGSIAIKLICKYQLLREDGIIIYEHVKDKPFELPEGMYIVDTRTYGITQVEFIKERVCIR